ncbi:MAG: TlpA family protein disulfide reductase [Cocleimonas sp.]|nr:TlpA family protein disulfide reductase [Cocleimonas sp.]
MTQPSSLKSYPAIRVFLLLSLLFAPFISQAKTPPEKSMIRDIAFHDINNKRHHLSEYRGKWLFINFWAGYCPICKKEIPTLIRFQQHNRNKVTVLGINYGGETRQKIIAAMKRHHFNYSIVPDQTSISGYFNDVVGTPTTIIISPQGRVVAKAVGRQSYQELLAYLGSQQTDVRKRIWDMDDSSN